MSLTEAGVQNNIVTDKILSKDVQIYRLISLFYMDIMVYVFLRVHWSFVG
jgi:hypothetical protein